MRTLLILLLAAPAFGAERTWTITMTTKAELVEVRGGVAFLQADGQIRPVPLERLSATDREYIASLPLVPVESGPVSGETAAEILPGPADDSTDADELFAPIDGPLLPPGPTFDAAEPELLPAPDLEFGSERPRLLPDAGPTTTASPRGPVQTPTFRQPEEQNAMYRPYQAVRPSQQQPTADPRDSSSSTNRRFLPFSRQESNEATSDSDRSGNDQRRRFFGRRGR